MEATPAGADGKAETGRWCIRKYFNIEIYNHSQFICTVRYLVSPKETEFEKKDIVHYTKRNI